MANVEIPGCWYCGKLDHVSINCPTGRILEHPSYWTEESVRKYTGVSR
jgi:Zinc knuckle